MQNTWAGTVERRTWGAVQWTITVRQWGMGGWEVGRLGGMGATHQPNHQQGMEYHGDIPHNDDLQIKPEAFVSFACRVFKECNSTPARERNGGWGQQHTGT
jgi:hypothetical protein